MNFGKNLQNFRKSKELSQEELAERMQVSRQAISKWESGATYPETEKLIELCNVLDCSMDTLVRGATIPKNKSDIKSTYDKIINAFSRSVSAGVMLILLGTSALLGFLYFGEPYEDYGLIAMLIFVAISVPIFVSSGIRYGNFKLKHPRLDNFYTESEVDRFNETFIHMTATAIGIIMAVLVVFIALTTINVFGTESTMPAAVFMIFLSFAVPILVYAGIQKSKYDVATYNHENSIPVKIIDDKIGCISGIIMMIATIIFLIAGFIWNTWYINWIVFPIGGIICGIVAIIFRKDGPGLN